MRLIDADEVVFHYGGLAKIPPGDGAAIAKYFYDQIKEMPTIEPMPNGPLTMEELREMDGEPVWCIDGNGYCCWCLVNCDNGFPCCIDNCTGLWDFCYYGMKGDGEYGLSACGWLSYRRKLDEVTK